MELQTDIIQAEYEYKTAQSVVDDLEKQIAELDAEIRSTSLDAVIARLEEEADRSADE